MALYEYWTEHPPLHIIAQGIASGMSGQRVGTQRPTKSTISEPTQITSASQLMGIIGGLGLPEIGVVRNNVN